MKDAFEDVSSLVRAGAAVIHVASFEWERVYGLCVGVAERQQFSLRSWSATRGVQFHTDSGWVPEDDAEDAIEEPSERLLAAIRQFRDLPERGVLLLEDVHPYLDLPRVTRLVREMARGTEPQRRKVIVLSTPYPALPSDLQKEVPTVALPLPDVEALDKVARRVAESYGLRYVRHAPLLEAARGLTVMEARLAFATSASSGKLGPSSVVAVAREKERVIRQSQVLEYYEPDAKLQDVGGLDTLKLWLDRRGRAFSEGARAFGLDTPRGVLLMGVQGCGKSQVAKAIAASWEFPLLRLDMGKVFGGLVGQSESNVRAALQVAEALAPCVLWIDEIEKGLAGLGSSDRSDGGTSARVIGTLLTWMQEKRAPVFVVATANRIEMLPPELLRKGRFDELFFVDLPTRSARKDILSIHLGKKGRPPESFDLEALADASIGFSGAELEEAVREGLFDCFSAGVELQTQHVLAAMKATTPLSRTMKAQIDELRRWARVRARLATSDLPEPIAGDGASVPTLRQEQRNPFVPEAS
jgi:SpoVK/Ycf46/Vps4 family AAA+-type ATPase